MFSTQAISNRRSKLTQSWNSILPPKVAILVLSGSPIQKPGGFDQCYPFLPHPCYFWVSGRRRPDEASLYSLETGWVDFQNPVSEAEVVWEGAEFDRIQPQHCFQDLESYLKKNGFKDVILMGQATHSKWSVSSESQELLWKLQAAFDSVRRCKDTEEIALIQNVARIAHKGYQKLKEVIRPGISEKDIRLAYETEVLRNGADGVPYETIVGAGTNSAILHAIPTPKIVQDGEMVLIDAGAEIQDYCVDITRVFAANGKFDSQQRALYDLVKKAQVQAVQMCAPGTYWNQVHVASAKIIAEGLRSLNILNCNSEDAIQSEAISVFFPHGVGHMVGLRVRDVGHAQNINPKKYAGAAIRIDLQLEEGHLVTAEPGCYFIKAFIKNEKTRQKYKDFINWSEVDKWAHVGGVRIEDDIFVTSSGPKNLTEIVEK